MYKRSFIVLACLLAFAAIVLGAAVPQAQAKTWKKVITVEGAGDVTTRPFALKGGQQKVTGQVTPDPEYPDMWVAGWFITPMKGYESASIEANEKTGKIATRAYLPKGKYYIKGMTANCSWTLTLWEKR